MGDVDVDLPRTFLRHADPRPADADPTLALFLEQRQALSEAPIVTSTDKVLNCVLPPREILLDSGEVLLQPVLPEQASRQELEDLRGLLEFKLADAKARPNGICAVRSAIYSMVFDELLRQVTISCPERGLLLLRVRDELRMTLDAYSSLFDTANGYAVRKQHEATKDTPAMAAHIDELTVANGSLRRQVRVMESRLRAMEQCAEDQRRADQRRHQEEKLFMEKTQQRLQLHMEAVKQAQELERRALRSEE